jgi:hypothetical protein
MHNLFIDTNIYLTFFHYTKDDLEEIQKLEHLISKREEIRIFLPDQVENEFIRNRDNKIAESLDNFRKEKFNNQFPSFCKYYPEYTNLRKSISEYEEHKRNLLEKLMKDIKNQELLADLQINKLFDLSIKNESTDEIIEFARNRHLKGNPPGKNDSYGDAINWEILLNNIPNNEDLYFISDDKDYYSLINPDDFNNYLFLEWRSRKNSNIFCYRSISKFFQDKYPKISLKTEIRKEEVLEKFINSSSYANTRKCLIDLVDLNEFSAKQVKAFIDACINNNQIYWIKDDNDIKQYINEILTANYIRIDSQTLLLFEKMYGYSIWPF